MPNIPLSRRLLSKGRFKSRFVRSVPLLVNGTVGAQLIMVLAAPVLTRLYMPQDLGLLAVFASLLSLISVVASLRYEIWQPTFDALGWTVILTSPIILGTSEHIEQPHWLFFLAMAFLFIGGRYVFLLRKAWL